MTKVEFIFIITFGLSVSMKFMSTKYLKKLSWTFQFTSSNPIEVQTNGLEHLTVTNVTVLPEINTEINSFPEQEEAASQNDLSMKGILQQVGMLTRMILELVGEKKSINFDSFFEI